MLFIVVSGYQLGIHAAKDMWDLNGGDLLRDIKWDE